MDVDRPDARAIGLAVDEDDVAQIGAMSELLLKEGEPVARRHQRSHVAVAEDVADLFGLQERIQRNEDGTGRRSAKARDHGLQAFVKVDPDSLGTAKAGVDDEACEGPHGGGEIAVFHVHSTRRQCGRVRRARFRGRD
jgi:hypothetical protein